MSKYTFLLPAFKAQFMREALRSILAQTYTDFCVIVSDDCSPEDLKSIVDEFAADPRVTYRRNERNMGSQSLVSHWNLLVDMCQTEWLIMASDDDIYDPRFLEEVDALQCKYPQVDILRSRVRLIDYDGDTIQEERLFEELLSQQDFVLDNYSDGHIQCVANFTFRTQALKTMNGFVDYPYAWASDDMTMQLMAKNSIAFTHNILFSFRMSGLNISTAKCNPVIDRKKLEAMIMYDCDLCRLVDSIDHNSTKLLQTKYKNWLVGHSKLFCGTLTGAAYCLKLREVLAFISKYKHYFNTLYSRYYFIARWLKH